MKITYDKNNGLSVPDGKIMEMANILLDADDDVTISQELLVNAIRVVMKTRGLYHGNVSFIFEDEEITINRYYQLSSWPRGFCDVTDSILDKLIGLE